MKIAKPPIFYELHASAMVNLAAEKKPPCLIVCVEPPTGMLAIASVTDEGIVHWTITGPTPADALDAVLEPFKKNLGLESESVHCLVFDSSKIVRHAAANDKVN